MKVLHVIPSLSPRHGGPSLALPAMASSLVRAGVQVDVVTTDDDGPGCRLPDAGSGAWISRDGWRVRFFPKQTEFYKVSLPLLFWLLRHVRDYDVVHVHAVFSFSTVAAGWAARLAGIPFIVRPLGTLNVWGMKNRRRWLKGASFRLLDRPILNAAAAIHCTSDQEAGEVSRLGLRSPAVVLPLGFETGGFHALPSRQEMESRWPAMHGREVLLFLSRLDEKKGVECLIDAFAKIRVAFPQSVLMLAGGGAPEYVGALKQRAAPLGDSVVWAGHVEGDAKRTLLGGADVFMLPSRSENFGIALLEAMASGLPCITTPGVALAHDEGCREALVVTPVDDAAALAEACMDLLGSLSRREALSRQARQAAQAFSSEVMASRLRDLYQRFIPSSSSPPPP